MLQHSVARMPSAGIEPTNRTRHEDAPSCHHGCARRPKDEANRLGAKRPREGISPAGAWCSSEGMNSARAERPVEGMSLHGSWSPTVAVSHDGAWRPAEDMNPCGSRGVAVLDNDGTKCPREGMSLPWAWCPTPSMSRDGAWRPVASVPNDRSGWEWKFLEDKTLTSKFIKISHVVPLRNV